MNRKKLLVVVDMQKDFVDGALGFNEASDILPVIVEKIHKANSDPDFLIAVTYDTHNPNYLETREGSILGVTHCVENSLGWQLNQQIEDALKDCDYLQLKKPSFGLDIMGIQKLKETYGDTFEEIHVCGLVSNMCVLSNVIVLQANYPEATIVVDPRATASFDPYLNQATMEVMAGLQVRIEPSEPVLSITQLSGEALKNEMIAWVRDYFFKIGAKGAVIGISGGKDSTVVSTILKEALGADRVFGVLMPNSVQSDIHDSHELVNYIKIPHAVINVGDAYKPLLESVANVFSTSLNQLNPIALVNTAPRIRMTTLYAVAAQLGYLVAGTGNRSEGFVGYFTKWGDGAHDFNLLANLTTEQVISVGHALGLPAH